MKKLYFLLTLILASSSFGQRTAVMVDTNSQVLHPANFFGRNNVPQMAQIYLPIGSTVTTNGEGTVTISGGCWLSTYGQANLGGFGFYFPQMTWGTNFAWTINAAGAYFNGKIAANSLAGDGSAVTNLPTPFKITVVSNLVINVASGVLPLPGGLPLVTAAQSIPLMASATNYIMFDLYMKDYHAYLTRQDRGSVYLGTVVTSGSAVSSIIQPSTFEIPKTRLTRTRPKLANNQPVYFGFFGDSTTLGFNYTSNTWTRILAGAVSFNPYYTNFPENLGTNVTYLNLGLGGSTARWGMALTGDTVTNETPLYSTDPFYGFSRSPYRNSIATNKFSTVGPSKVTFPLFDCVTIGFGVNQTVTSTEELGYIETQARYWRQLGCDVILWNQQYYSNNASCFNNAYYNRLRDIADQHGCEMVDTFSRVWEIENLRGTNLHGDNIHLIDLGELVTARGFRSLFSIPQTPEFIPPNNHRLLINVVSNWFPNKVEIELPMNAGTATNCGDGSVSIPVLMYGQQQTNSSHYQPQGSSFNATFSGVLGLDLAHSGHATNAWVNLGGSGSTSNKWTSILMPAVGDFYLTPLITTGDLSPIDSLVFTTSEYWRKFIPSSGFTITVASNSLNADAIICYTMDGYTVPWSVMHFDGGWTNGRAFTDPSGRWMFSDDSAFGVDIPYKGVGLTLYLTQWKSASKINVWIDGKPYLSGFDLYQNTPNAINLAITVWPNAAIGTPYTDKWENNYGDHVVRIEYGGINGSAVAPSGYQHLFSLYGVKTVDPR